MKKRVISWVLTAALTAGCIGVTASVTENKIETVEAATSGVIGDLTGDSKVNADDFVKCVDAVAGSVTLDSSTSKMIDVNADGAYGDSRDVVRYKKYLMEPDVSGFNPSNTEYHITNAAELYGFAMATNYGRETFAGKTVYVDNDITVNIGDEGSWNPEKELLKTWDSIGSEADFAGTFDGQGHTISGLFGNSRDESTGLFETISETAVVKNLRLTDSRFVCTTGAPDNTTAGSIVAEAKGSLEGIYSDATVTVATKESVDTVSIPPTYFTKDSLSAVGSYTVTDTEYGMQITGNTWSKGTKYTYATPISGADIETITARFKVTGGEAAILYLYNAQGQKIYVNLSGITSGTEGYVDKYVDDDGMTVVTFDFKRIGAGGEAWGTDTRETESITAIEFCCNNATGAPTFDYISYNGEAPGRTVTDMGKIEFSTANTVKGNKNTIADKDGVLSVIGTGWGSQSDYARHTLAAPISGSDIDIVTIRYKAASTAFYLHNENGQMIYLWLSSLNSSNPGFISRTTDSEGYDILKFDFKTITTDEAWAVADRATQNLTAITMMTTGSTEALYDWISFSKKTMQEPDMIEVDKVKFTTTNTTAGNTTMSDSADGLSIAGPGWSTQNAYARYTFATPINGADIEVVTVRYKGTNAIMYLHNESGQMIYLSLTDLAADAGFISQTIDAAGFKTLKFNFKTVASAEAWSPADRETKQLTAITMMTSDKTTTIFDYISFEKQATEEAAGKGYGGLVGLSNGATIKQCWFAGTVKSNHDYLGGIAGNMEADSTITDSMMSGTVTSTMNATQEKFTGGIVGISQEASTGNTIKDTVMLGNVNVTWKDTGEESVLGARAVGSVVGRNLTNITFDSVYAGNTVTNKSAGGTVNITNGNLPGCGDLSADGATGAPMQRTKADIIGNVSEIATELGSDMWTIAEGTPVLSSFADLKSTVALDSSYMTVRSGGGIYFSNFNDAEVMNRVTEVGINPWDNYLGDEVATATHATISNGYGGGTGIKLQTSGGYSGVKYSLPEKFMLNDATSIGLKFTASGWHNGTIASFIYLTSGDKKVNITDYADVYNGTSTASENLNTTHNDGHLSGVNYLTICMTIDVSTLMNEFNLTSIDGIIFGQSNTGTTQVLDEFYYMPKNYTPLFNTSNTTGGSATKTDVDGNLQMSGVAWQRAVYDLSAQGGELNGGNIHTLTMRYKKPSAGVAILELFSGSKLVYINLGGPTTDAIISQVTDSDGYTILTLDFYKLAEETNNNWSKAERKTLNLTDIKLCINNAGGVALFDYLEFGYAGDTDEAGLPEYAPLANPMEEGLELAAYCPPTITADTVDARYQDLKDSGIRTVYMTLWGSYDVTQPDGANNVKLAMDACERLGLDVYIAMNNGRCPTSTEEDEPSWWDKLWGNTSTPVATCQGHTSFIETFKDYHDTFKTYDCFKGVYGFDEPNNICLDWIKSDMDSFYQTYSSDKYEYLVTLMRNDGGTAWEDGLSTAYYNEYWNKVLQYNPNNTLLYDTYPLYVNRDSSQVDSTNKSETTGTPFIRDFVLPVLEEYAVATKNTGTDMYTFIQTYADKYDVTGRAARNNKSVADVRFQVAYNMAYGSKGHLCFTYESQSQFGASMIYATGSKLNNYYYVQEVFNELKDWEHVYMAFDWQGTLDYNGTATGNGVQSGHLDKLNNQLITSHDRINSVSTEYDLLVGTFKDGDNNDGFLITTYTDPYYEIDNTVSVKFNNATKALVYKNGKLVTNQGKTNCYMLTDGVLEMTLNEGDYLFVVPVQ